MPYSPKALPCLLPSSDNVRKPCTHWLCCSTSGTLQLKQIGKLVLQQSLLGGLQSDYSQYSQVLTGEGTACAAAH